MGTVFVVAMLVVISLRLMWINDSLKRIADALENKKREE